MLTQIYSICLTLSSLPLMFIGPTLGPAGFCTMNGIVLFLILHIYTGAKDTNSSKNDIELKYRYIIDHKVSENR